MTDEKALHLTNWDLLDIIVLDDKAIAAELATKPSDDLYASWFKTELAETLLPNNGFTVNEEVPFAGVEATWSDTPERYAVGLVTGTAETPVTLLLQDAVKALATVQGDYAARYVAGLPMSADEASLIEAYVTIPENQAVCSLAVRSGIMAIVVTVG